MLHMGLDLQETTCHVLNPKPFEECKVRMMFDTVSHTHTHTRAHTLTNTRPLRHTHTHTHTVQAER